MSIPKIIHYCWFGGNPLPDKVKHCIESWKKFCPDYKIIQWDESNYDVNKIQYINDAYKEKKWAFVSDYARLDVVYNYGGIYLDIDVELKKNLDELLESSVFFAMEKQNMLIATGLGFGSEPLNLHIKNLLEIYNSLSFYKSDGTLNLTPCTLYTTEYFEKLGYKTADVTQKIDGVVIFSSDYFCPMNFLDGSLNITEKTFGIHWYDASWFSEDDKKIHNFEAKCRRKFPKAISILICFLYRKSYRLVEYCKKGILITKIIGKIKKVF